MTATSHSGHVAVSCAFNSTSAKTVATEPPYSSGKAVSAVLLGLLACSRQFVAVTALAQEPAKVCEGTGLSNAWQDLDALPAASHKATDMLYQSHSCNQMLVWLAIPLISPYM